MRDDAVTPLLRHQVFARDKVCILRKMDPRHQCKDAWGFPHAAGDVSRLTLDHVHLDGGHMGQRAPSDLRHLVAMCAYSNIQGPSREEREFERQYLRRLYER